MFIFNGRQRNVLEFKQESETAKSIGKLSFQTGISTVYSTTAILKGQDSVWLFAGNNHKATNPVLLFNTANEVAYIPTENSISLPTLVYCPASVWDGRQGYLIGGFGREKESDKSYLQRMESSRKSTLSDNVIMLLQYLMCEYSVLAWMVPLYPLDR
jgi:hypothetical protein